jgi:hypothetical protein
MPRNVAQETLGNRKGFSAALRGIGLQHLRQWSARRAQLEVDYDGAPDLGAVAVSVRERND